MTLDQIEPDQADWDAVPARFGLRLPATEAGRALRWRLARSLKLARIVGELPDAQRGAAYREIEAAGQLAERERSRHA
jgi:hypothetical protein